MKITTVDVLKYTLLPGLLPRFRDLFSVGFSHFAYFIAMIFEAIRILPPHHPYLRAENFGRFTVGQVLVQAYRHITFNVRHLDQIVIYGTVCFGVILFFLQVALLIFSFMAPFAQAAAPEVLSDIVGINTEGTRPDDRKDDVAFMLLDRVFGIENMFNSRVTEENWPYPYHAGLHTLFATYSTALLVVAILILTYFITTILAETVRDGTAFGKRFNKVWAVIRLVAAVGLLVPINSGLNAGQFIVMVAAKWGSNFATNGMGYYYETVTENGETPWGPVEDLVAVPSPPDPTNLLHFMLVARACQFATQSEVRFENPNGQSVRNPINGYLLAMGEKTIRADLVGPLQGNLGGGFGWGGSILTEQAYKDMIQDVNAESLIFVFGSKATEGNNYLGGGDMEMYAETGNVHPFCGVMSFPIISSLKRDENAPYNEAALPPFTNEPVEPAAFELQWKLLEITFQMWQDTEIINAAAAIADNAMKTEHECPDWHLPSGVCDPGEVPNIAELRAVKVDEYKEKMDEAIKEAIANNADSLKYCGPPDDPYYEKYGWAGAAICYNSIPALNGVITSAGTTLPDINHWPRIMEDVAKKRARDSASLAPNERFDIRVSGDDGPIYILSEDSEQGQVAMAGNAAYIAWLEADDSRTSGGGVIDIINMIFGTQGVFDMLAPENRDKHPMALLASAGRGLVEATIRNLGAGAVGIGLSLFVDTGGIGNIISSFMMNIARITIVAGFVLFYLVPLLPFMYYFFAVGAWIKALFEAMVGVPLWALAHIRIDGDGLPGSAAMNGYLLILEIFLRPILIFFGLLASAVIFYAMVKILNELWSLVVYNVAGFDEDKTIENDFMDIEFWRGPVDEFFFTIIYVIIVYMMAMSSFKLIDMIPNFMLRWLGQSVEAFGETIGDPTARMSQQATVGFSGASTQLIGGAETLGQAVDYGAKGMARAKQQNTQSPTPAGSSDPAAAGAANQPPQG
jgi:conjugal transfer/type IV secretion protein DotA/TraY